MGMSSILDLNQSFEVFGAAMPSPEIQNALIQIKYSVPEQRLDGRRTYLEVPLLRGRWLVVDNEGRTTSLK
jgi:hypothetical protein